MASSGGGGGGGGAGKKHGATASSRPAGSGAVKEKYNITFLKASNLPDGQVVVCWKRGAKKGNKGQTQPRQPACGLVEWNETVTVQCTLVKEKSGSYEAKHMILALKELKGKKKVLLGKITVNLADYADMNGIESSYTYSIKRKGSKTPTTLVVKIASENAGVAAPDEMTEVLGLSESTADDDGIDADEKINFDSYDDKHNAAGDAAEGEPKKKKEKKHKKKKLKRKEIEKLVEQLTTERDSLKDENDRLNITTRSQIDALTRDKKALETSNGVARALTDNMREDVERLAAEKEELQKKIESLGGAAATVTTINEKESRISGRSEWKKLKEQLQGTISELEEQVRELQDQLDNERVAHSLEIEKMNHDLKKANSAQVKSKIEREKLEEVLAEAKQTAPVSNEGHHHHNHHESSKSAEVKEEIREEKKVINKEEIKAAHKKEKTTPEPLNPFSDDTQGTSKESFNPFDDEPDNKPQPSAEPRGCVIPFNNSTAKLPAKSESINPFDDEPTKENRNPFDDEPVKPAEPLNPFDDEPPKQAQPKQQQCTPARPTQAPPKISQGKKTDKMAKKHKKKKGSSTDEDSSSSSRSSDENRSCSSEDERTQNTFTGGDHTQRVQKVEDAVTDKTKRELAVCEMVMRVFFSGETDSQRVCSALVLGMQQLGCFTDPDDCCFGRVTDALASIKQIHATNPFMTIVWLKTGFQIVSAVVDQLSQHSKLFSKGDAEQKYVEKPKPDNRGSAAVFVRSLRTCVFRIFDSLVQSLIKSLTPLLPMAVFENSTLFTPNPSRKKATMAEVRSILSAMIGQAQEVQLPRPLFLQLFCNVLNWIDATCFNALVKKPGLITCTSGFQLKLAVSTLDELFRPSTNPDLSPCRPHLLF
eukprot:TRINITY_DN2581_c0_g1_i8.p1 TRINITY_DN2581_c0_g1~~TRINITY_DN2581_c0_g1_i8.p1  ORF type:complete len:895 (+),score=251.60 TRINITY_DN2581_c0_g1_i8:55-2685(+)